MQSSYSERACLFIDKRLLVLVRRQPGKSTPQLVAVVAIYIYIYILLFELLLVDIWIVIVREQV